MDDLLLDRIDLGLLLHLQRDGQATQQALGEALHLSGSQVSRRIQRLTSLGVILRVVALLDASVVDLRVRAFTYVTLSRHGGQEAEGFERAVQDVAEVLDCYSIAGDADYLLQIVAPSLAALSEDVLSRITHLPGVVSVRSSVALNRVKSTTELPLGHIGRAVSRHRSVKLV